MHWYAAMNYGWMESSWTWRCVSHQHKKRRALSPHHMRTMSVGNNDGEMQGEGWSFLLWQASKQPAGWIAVIGVKCPQLVVHWQSCAARSSILSLRRSCRRRGEEGGRYRCETQQSHSCGANARSGVENEAAAPLQNRLPYHHWVHMLGRRGWYGCRWWKGRSIFSTVPSNGFFSVWECVCFESATYERESFYNHWPLSLLEMPAWDWLWEWLTSTLIVLLYCQTKRCQWITV